MLKTSSELNNIQELSDILISRIAAGEVIERPSSVVKELVENSIDAGAENINITILDGGRNLIEINDDGYGIKKEELSLALKRHATSKLKSNNLLNINSLGFRGEGLASISSVAKLTLTSKFFSDKEAYKITSNGGILSNIEPANLAQGTIISAKDLFFATPARLKFLKSERSEINNIIDIIKKIALAHHKISFNLKIDGKNYLEYEADSLSDYQPRIINVLGKEFFSNSIEIDYQIDDYKIFGFASIPTYHRSSSNVIYSFVNDRPIRDKFIINAIKTAYQDFLARDKYPVICLFIKISYYEVDVNVHPTKAEVRFRDSSKLRNIIITALKQALQQGAFKASSEVEKDTFNYFQKNLNKQPSYQNYSSKASSIASQKQVQQSFIAQAPNMQTNLLQNNDTQNENHQETDQFAPQSKEYTEINPELTQYPLGSAVAQLHKTYIVSQTENGLVIVDQHAAHERIVYEELKKSLKDKKVVRQTNLFSEIVQLTETEEELLFSVQENLLEYGIVFEKTEAGIFIKEMPEIFVKINMAIFIKELIDNIAENGGTLNLLDKWSEIYGNYACHNAIRAGRELNIAEMNDILRKMETTPFTGQCNHGRPTYVELKKNNLEKLFGRK